MMRLDQDIADLAKDSTVDQPITEISGWSMRKRGPWTF